MQITYNFCQLLQPTSVCEERKELQEYANLRYTDDTQRCTELTGDGSSLITFNAIDQRDPEMGVKVYYHGGPTITNSQGAQVQVGFKMIVHCQRDMATNALVENDYYNKTENGVEYQVFDGISKAACPVVTVSQIYRFISSNKWPFTILFGLIGLFQCFFSMKYKKVA